MYNSTLTSPPIPELNRKKNGIFYTPPEVTSILCKWAIRSADDHLLEPGFGGCGFLAASYQRLTELNAGKPEDRLFGCDIDPRAFEFLSQTLKVHSYAKRFLRQDFLNLQPSDFAVEAFTSTIGNPPYVSYHAMSDGQRESANALTEVNGLRMQNKPSLWAYFVLHSLKFLKVGGRCAWLLPSSFLFADYAREIRELLQRYFSRSLILILGERIFLAQGTEERTVVLLCEDWHPNECGGTMEMGFASDLNSLDSTIDGWSKGSWQGVECEARANLALMTGDSLLSYTELQSSSRAKLLGSLCKIRIGIVTGANSFFVVNEEKAISESIPADALSFVLSRFNDVRTLSLRASDLQRLRRDGKRCLLIDTSLVNNVEGDLKRYLDKFPTATRDLNKTFQKRKLWHRPNDGLIPDAFLSYMQANGPSLILNVAKITSTNTIHRVFFNGTVNGIYKKAIAISILSTFSQLSAEIEGRSYGSGVLKHEPSEAYNIALLLPSVKDEVVKETFNKVESLLRKGSTDKAQAEADNFVLSGYPERVKQYHISALARALKEARARRQRPSV